MTTTRDIGNRGEEIAIAYLKEHGYKILSRNWIFQKAEIDIVAEHDGFLVIVEVKARATVFFGEPESFVDKAKQQHLIRAAQGYVEEFNVDSEVRFDVISILLLDTEHHVKHIKDAFSPLE